MSEMEWNDLKNTHPGTILKLDFLPEMGVSTYRLAKLLGITQTHLTEILDAKRAITANISLRLGRLFEQSPGFWLGLQNSYDLRKATAQYGDEIAKVAAFKWPGVEADKIAA
jgi:addiction module HigA family antidote